MPPLEVGVLDLIPHGRYISLMVSNAEVQHLDLAV
jgi:hypothetical protein